MSEAVKYVKGIYESMTDLQLDAVCCALINPSLAEVLRTIAEDRCKEDGDEG